MARSTRIVIEELGGASGWRAELSLGGRLRIERILRAETFEKVIEQIKITYHELVPTVPAPPPPPAPDVALRPVALPQSNVRGRAEVARLREIRPAGTYRRGDDPGPEAA
jgi:hypothetical protein